MASGLNDLSRPNIDVEDVEETPGNSSDLSIIDLP